MGRSHLFKYLDLDSGLKVLSESKIRFNRPTKFNDPFDMQAGIRLPIDGHDYNKAMSKRLNKAIDSGNAYGIFGKFTQLIPNSMLIEKIKSFQSDTKLVKNLLNKSELIEGWEQLQSDFNHQVRTYLENCYVSCFSETGLNLLMWAHYTRSHAGICIKFRTYNSGREGFVRHAKPVVYKENPPFPCTKSELIDQIVNNQPLSFREDWSKDLLFTKSRHWKYEREWRLLVTPKKLSVYGQFGQLPFFAREVDSIYIGARTPQAETSIISEIVRLKYPDAKIFRCTKSESTYEIKPQPLNVV